MQIRAVALAATTVLALSIPLPSCEQDEGPAAILYPCEEDEDATIRTADPSTGAPSGIYCVARDGGASRFVGPFEGGRPATERGGDR